MSTTYNEHENEHEIRIGRLDAAYRGALERLAERDSAIAPQGPEILGALVDGELIAATSVAGGDTVADPFTHSARARALLESRVAEVRKASSRGGGRLKRLLGRRSRAALPSSPPGGGGRFLMPPPPECR